MTRYFTHYWGNRTWKYMSREAEGEILDHIAGNLFEQRGLSIGDKVYVVTVKKGKLYLCGSLIVGKLCGVEEAADFLNCDPENLWEAEEHIIASASTPMAFNLMVPLELTKQLRFKSAENIKPLVFKSDECLDQQTLRGVRELEYLSALELDKLLSPLEEIDRFQIYIDAENNLNNQSTSQDIHELSMTQDLLDIDNYFDRDNEQDNRERVIREIACRRGQKKFREQMMKIYNKHCAITDCDAEEALEAAHIIPYNGIETNHPTNGLLLRADIHTLFDLHLISLNPETKTVEIAPSLANTCYRDLIGKRFIIPQEKIYQPNRTILEKHYQDFIEKNYSVFKFECANNYV
ncbi:MAG TPA: HNH endonuclease [Nostocaceae cyanobacterium]|nr:HNH endonuclease [Nostocaceae cyanobacterium]